MNYREEKIVPDGVFSKKHQFVKDYNSVVSPSYIIVVVQVPSGAKETIINSTELDSKFAYYLETYDKDLVMYANMRIRILDWIIV